VAWFGVAEAKLQTGSQFIGQQGWRVKPLPEIKPAQVGDLGGAGTGHVFVNGPVAPGLANLDKYKPSPAIKLQTDRVRFQPIEKASFFRERSDLNIELIFF
jgi:hypothetical protein